MHTTMNFNITLRRHEKERERERNMRYQKIDNKKMKQISKGRIQIYKLN